MKHHSKHTISEVQVQRAAQDLLKKRYRGYSWGKRIFSQLEVTTKKAYGNKRADGLLAFRHILWGVYVVSMEAKSYKTLKAIRSYRDHGSLLLGSLKWGFYGCLGSGSLLILLKQSSLGFSQILFPLTVFLFCGAAYALLTHRHVCHQISQVIEQIRQYPADHQWLAVSQDSLDRLAKSKKRLLKQTCRYQGIGIIVVNRRKRAKVWVKPKRNWFWGGNYLKYYSLEEQIFEKI